ncbi:MAG TPA: DNA repair exonuclease [Bacillales bacterium]|nr:DNA repair exonuclease [Bacillales bacterium]
MPSIRFIHCADLHLDRPFHGLADLPPLLAERVRESTFHSFRRVVDAALREAVDFVIIAGDLFDGSFRSLRAQVRFRNETDRLRDAGIQVYVVHGNHDPLGGEWTALTWPKNVHTFGAEVEMKPFRKNGETLAYLYGFSYRERTAENQLSFYKKKPGARFHIGILHGQESSGSGEGVPYAPFKTSDLLEKRFDYWALGHVHQRNILHENPYIAYPGNIQGLSAKETGEKGCLLVEMSDAGTDIHFLKTNEIAWRDGFVSIDEFESVDELMHACELLCENERSGSGCLLTIRFGGNGPLHRAVADETVMEDLLSSLRDGEQERDDFAWVVNYANDAHPDWNRDEWKRENHFIADLLRVIDEDMQEDALEPLLENRNTHRFAKPLLAERREIVKEAERLLLSELLAKGDIQ